jgi:hypothetical protein
VARMGPVSSSLLLFQGDLGAYNAARLRQGELPSTLAARRIEAIGWNDAGRGDAVLAPSVPLEPSGTYTLAALGAGPIVTLLVDPAASPIAERIWPPRGSLHGGSRSVFCAEGAAVLGQGPVRLEPVGLEATAWLGADAAGRSSERCVHLEAEDPIPSGVAVPPPEIGKAPMDPAPIVLDPATTFFLPQSCPAAEISFGPGCALVQDDRVVVRSVDVPVLWSIEMGSNVRIEPALANERFVLTGLLPSTEVSVDGSVTDLSGQEETFATVLDTAAPRPHVVINEVLANPLGPEPQQEWIELVNDGTERVDLTGFLLSDSAGDTILPRATLDPSEFALIVGEGFQLSDGRDPPPAPGTLIIRVPHVGSDGLSNSGEALALYSADGKSVSRFPAVPASRPGVSIVRRVASVLDDDGTAFFPSPDGGATPGWKNHITTP